ncbi:MAG: hypothetical protein BMS9Abin17_0363 [Acidimicrobiia bacterium]|nr:MAG: hypothetical protein BMS9Abin17_0363 [Acidimicrobiia bacterium]
MIVRTDVRRRTRATILIVAAVVAAFLTGLLLTSSSVFGESTRSDRAAGLAVESSFRSRTTYVSLDGLRTASDLIAVGTVIGVKPGRLAGDPRDGPEGQVQFHDVAILINEVLAGPGTAELSGTQLRIEMLFLPGSSGSFTSSESPWWQPGASSLFFLRFDSSAPGRESVLVSPEGIQFLPDGQDGSLAAAGTKPIPRIEGSTVMDVRTALASQASG